MKKYFVLILTALLVVTLAVGCGNKNKAEQNNPPAPNQPSENHQQEGEKKPDTDKLPQTKEVVISMEGMEEKFTFHLYDHPLFSTYYPGEDFVSDEVSSGEGDAVWFFANYGGNLNEEVYLQIYVLGDGNASTKEEFISIVSGQYGIAEMMDWQLDKNNEPVYPWSIAEYLIKQTGDSIPLGTMYLGQHEDRFFMITIHAPGEWAEGFYPRARHIIQELQWKSAK